MADRVFLHIGLPKTGTTYLQGVLWAHRDQVRRDGVLLPGAGHREHLWAALDAQDRKHLERRGPRARGAWGRLRDELNSANGTGLVTHEFFCGASREQAERVIADLAPAEVSKASGLASVCERLGVAPQDVLALGDGRNDTEMLRWAGRGVAMGQAPLEVQEAADFVTSTVDDDGAAQELERWFPAP